MDYKKPEYNKETLETEDVLTSSLSIGESDELSDGITITRETAEKGSITTFISNIFK